MWFPNNTVIDDNQIVGGFDNAVGHIIDMGYEVIPTGIFGDESSQFGIFDGYFFNSGTQRKQLFKLTVFKIFLFCMLSFSNWTILS